MTMMRAGPISFSLLLLLSIGQRANCGQVESQDPNSSGTNAPGKTSAASGKRIFVATLPKTVDVKKLKAGDTLAAVESNLGILIASPITFSGRILDVHTLGSGNKESRLVIRFESLKFGDNQELLVDLKLQAVVSPLALKWSFSPIIVDRYPCDYEADPKGCQEKAQKQEHISQPGVGGMTRIVCKKNPKHGQGQPSDDCVPVSEARGAYGFPDLSVAPYPDDSAQDFAITSIRKNVHLEQGTILIFSGSTIELSQKPKS
jgi:hypothetical protein